MAIVLWHIIHAFLAFKEKVRVVVDASSCFRQKKAVAGPKQLET